MRVIFVNRFFFPDHSATSQLLSDLAFDLAQRGVAVTVIASRQKYGDAGAALPRSETVNGVQIIRVATPTFGRGNLFGRALDYLGFFVSASWRVLRVARRGDVVVPMTDPPLIGVKVGVFARLRGARVVNWFQDVFPEIAERLSVPGIRVLAGPLRALRSRSMRKAQANVAIGERMADLLQGSSGVRPTVIPNWGLEEIPDNEAESEVRSRASHPLRADWNLGDSLIVGYSGNLGRAHQLDVLIDAAAALRETPGIVFLFIGDGAQRAELQARVSALGLTNVIFRPYQPREQLRSSLTLPDIHVVTLDERLEGLIVPSKFVGVVALGKPVLWIGAKDGEVGVLVQQSGCGVSVPPGDSTAIAAAVSELAKNPETLTHMERSAVELWGQKLRRETALMRWFVLLTA